MTKKGAVMPEYDCINQRITKMEDKLESHKDTLERHDRRLTDLTTSLQENTALTKTIADNTGEMVTMFKEAKVVYKWGVLAKRFLVWAASVTAAIIFFWDNLVQHLSGK
jgi:hypothetical protein